MRSKTGGGARPMTAGPLLTLCFIVLASVHLAVAAAEVQGTSAGTLTGPAADVIRFRAFDVDRAPLDLEAGRMDLYMYNLKTTAAQRLLRDGNFRLLQAPASTVSLILNPAPARQGELNPFSIPQVRRAMQYLVDRDFIANEIYQGMATPMITHVSPQDYDFLNVYPVQRGAGIAYAPEYARELIAEAMREAGAELRNGVWHYAGRPVRVKLIGRVEDERRDIADLVRTELEAAGFEVAISYRPFAAAVLSVYSTDPKAFEWHIYTEGWGKGSPQRYDYATINQMLAPWLGNMPGWREVGFWQYEHAELDELGKRLFRGEFTSREERDELYRRMTEIGLEESVRIWLVTATNTFPADPAITGVTEDLVAGPRSPWTLREAHVPGASELTIGHLWVWTERTTWNPVGGLGDVYSTDIWRALTDPVLWNHPFSGLPMPVRGEYAVETAGPEGKLDVPADAVMWNAQGDRWQPVGSGVRATSKVVFDYSKYFSGKWHHGVPITMADVAYDIVQGYELAYDPDKARIEVALGVTSRPYLETFKGYRFVDENRIEVYVDFWHFEESLIASYAVPSGLATPWEIRAAMDYLVFEQRRAAYSDTAAARFNVPWLSLVMERDAGLVATTLRTFQSRKIVPSAAFQIGNRTLLGQNEARSRFEAALGWFNQWGHFVIGNGPYFLAEYDPPAQYAELRAFRDPSYPFSPGDWLFGRPPELSVDAIEAPPVTAGEAAEIRVRVRGAGNLGLNYLLVDPVTGEVVTQGDAQVVSTQAGETGDSVSTFGVALGADVTAGLFPGLYQLYVVAHSDAAAKVVERAADVEVLP